MGEEDETFTGRGDDAIELLHELHDYHHEMKTTKSEPRALETLGNFLTWKALEELLSRPWWTRVWTLQEYLVPSNFTFWCDRSYISRESLNKALYVVYKLTKLSVQGNRLSAKSWYPAWSRRRLRHWYRKRSDALPLVALISYGSESKATDPKDRIYSMFNLAKKDDEPSLIKPNYKKDFKASDAYIDFFKAFVKEHDSLDIMCFVHIFNQRCRGSKSVGDLPSWVPDWTAQVAASVMPVMASQASNPSIGNFRPFRRRNEHQSVQGYAASGHHPPRYTISNDKKILTCIGTVVDVVQSIAGTRNESCLNLPLSRTTASIILDEITRTLLLDREDKYLNHPSSPGQFYNDFRALCRAAERNPESIPDSFFHWFRSNQDLVILGHSLKEICRRSLKRPAFASPPTDISTQRRFLDRFEDTTEGMMKMLVTTTSGWVGMAPKRSQQEDKICVILGCSIPLVLRKRATPNGGKKEYYEVVGECYLSGVMAGEVVEQADAGYLKYEELCLL